MSKSNSPLPVTDVVLIGAGIMSATLGMLLKQLEPAITIQVIERLDEAAAESSDAWNNAGTGHSAFCELNYTPELPDGSIDISKAIKIASSFEESKQFWAWLIANKLLSSPETFVESIPHMSFVWDNNVSFLEKRYHALQQNHLFKGMQFSTDGRQLQEWIPLVMQGRDKDQRVAATRMALGTDVNFGALTRSMFAWSQSCPGVETFFHQEVRDIEQESNGRWVLKVKDEKSGEKRRISSKFVFIGAGGGSLPLLLKSDIPESKGYGGFPVSGQWLKCTNRAIIEKHHVKVYGKAAVGAPPMSVPHLDTRMIKGKHELLFGPYAGFSTRFLKHGSLMDLPMSLRVNNIMPMIAAGMDNIALTKYLIQQVLLNPQERLAALQAYFPEARMEDWELEIAGQRVQVIKKDEAEGGVLEFGTELVSAADGSLAALLGASPGASTAVSIMLNLLKQCFPQQYQSAAWQNKLQQMIPSFGQSLEKDEALCLTVRNWSGRILGISQ